MIKISVKGIDDGNVSIDLNFPSKEIENLSEEFFGDISITGKLTKIKNRYNFQGNVECKAEFVCDRSLKEYTDVISNELNWTCLRDTDEFNDDEESAPGILAVKGDEDEIDITDEVVEQLIVAIPMKRIAPEYRDRDISEIYPDFVADEDDQPKTNPAFSKLEDLKFN